MADKYSPLYRFLLDFEGNEWSASFAEIEHLGIELPATAYNRPQWWENNTTGHPQAQAWISAGWETSDVDLGAESLVFVRSRSVSGR